MDKRWIFFHFAPLLVGADAVRNLVLLVCDRLLHLVSPSLDVCLHQAQLLEGVLWLLLLLAALLVHGHLRLFYYSNLFNQE